MSAQKLSAKLDRTDPKTPWGFRLHGGKDFSSPLTIQRVTPGSMAAKCGLQVGDHITLIGDTPTDDLFHKDAQQKILSSGNSLDLKLERGGFRATQVEDTPSFSPSYNPQPSYQPKPAAPAQGQNYNVKPKPFVPGGSAGAGGSTVPVAMNNQYNTPINMYSVGNVMSSLTTQTGGLDVSSGNSVMSMAPSQHAPPPLPASNPPPPPSSSMHVPPPLHDLHLHDPEVTPPSPQPYSPGGNYSSRASTSTTSSVREPRVRARVGGGSPPRQSAVTEEVDDGEVPRFRGYTNPSSQSRTFKILQEKVNAGEEISPGLGATKPTPVKPVGKPEEDSKYTKAIMNRQYNTPASLYSNNNISDTFSTQATNLIDKLQRDEEPASPPDTGKKVYVASETYRMVQALDAGDDKEGETSSAKRGPMPASFTPSKPYQSEQQGSSLRATTETTDRLSPGYSPSYKAPTNREPAYKAPEKITVREPAYSPTYKPSTDVNANNRSPTYKPDLEPKSYTTPTQSSTYSKTPETVETLVQNRATITVSPRIKQDSKTVKDLPTFRNQSPRPFQKPQDEPSKPAAPSFSAAPGGGTWKPQIPTGPRQMKVGRLGEARSMPASAPGRIPVCSGCGVSIRGPFVLALDKSWCPDHFMCANPQCGRPLIDVGFVEEGGQLYCEKDYEQFLAPRCGKCGGAIVGDRIEATSTSYHPDCFVCTHCRQPIGGTSFHIEGGEFYCQKDWASLFQTKCYGCQFPIEPGDKWVEALGQNWHSECFNCSTCQVNLEGQPFYAKAGKPFCKKHAMGARF